MRRAPCILVPFAAAIASSSSAATFQVGPTRSIPDLATVAPLLQPGDVVEVDGGHAYSGEVVFKKSGTKEHPIKIIGKRSADKRPVLQGGKTTVELRGDHYVLEGFDITGGSVRCVFHHADDVTIRDTMVHDCPGNGILGADDDSGSLTLDYVEVTKCGESDHRHPIYVATDEKTHPKSVFRMQHCYLHDENGGNAVKSRAERNEIYANWIEGALYHELELIGPELDGDDVALAREDSDVVGNVFKKTRGSYVVRIGGDGSGDTSGRYRFVNNTFLMSKDSRSPFRLFDRVESVEMHNNVVFKSGGGAVQIIQDDDVTWSTGKAIIAGSNNLIPRGSTKVPTEWTNTLLADPMFVSESDPEPREKSPLLDAGAATLRGPHAHEFPNPLALPAFLPPLHALEKVGAAKPRPKSGAIDIGAFERTPTVKAVSVQIEGDQQPDTLMPPSGPAKSDVPVVSPTATSSGWWCACSPIGEAAPGAPALALAALALLGVLRSSRGRRRVLGVRSA